IDSSKISKTYLLGSEGLIPNDVANQLKNVERLAGKDRYATNENIFNRFKDELNLSHLYIASSLDFPDALATSALAAKTNSFVVLSYPTYPALSLRTIINSSKDTLDKVYVIGSKGLIADDTFISAGIGIIK
ncbi:cell wall-binding repeat-containing protein, partial [Clostridium saudiense]|nr:cell wall-binding repeat-containing protein [Clostridium saudiense]